MSNKKFTFEEVERMFRDKGYVLLETEYKNNRTPMRFICPNHPHKEMSLRLEHLKRGVGCRYCGNEQKALKLKFQFDEVKKEFEKRGYDLLDTKYKNSKTKLKYRCPKHPDKELSITLSDLKAGYGCIHCAGKAKYTLDEVNRKFEERGYKLLESKYVNTRRPLKYQCPHHPNKELYISFSGLLNGQGCAYCAGQGKPTFEDVKALFKKRNYELLNDTYINGEAPLKYSCPKHPDRVLQVRFHHFKNGSGCPYCAKDNIKGEGSHFWKGGVNTLSLFLRAQTKEWKMAVLKTFDYECDITGENHNNLEVHHSESFHSIRDEVLKELNLKPFKRTNGYTPQELEKIKNLFIKKQEKVQGFPLRKDIHDLFHKLYGKKVTIADYFDFKKKYKDGEIEETVIEPRRTDTVTFEEV